MLTLRPYQPDDLDALCAISLATGHEGGDASHLYEDPKLIGHSYSALKIDDPPTDRTVWIGRSA